MSDEGWRAALFLAYLGPAESEEMAGPELEAALAQALSEGERRWPGVPLPPERFLRFLADRVADRSVGPVDQPAVGGRAAAPELLRTWRTGDLYLACACAELIPAALTTLEREIVDKVEPALRHIGAGDALVADVRQELLAALLVPRPSGKLGISGYAGEGSLRSWARSIAVRIAMRRLKNVREFATDPSEVGDRIVEPGLDLQLDHMRRRYAVDFAAAFRESLAALPVRQRNLLRQHHIDGLTVDQLGTLYRVHRATAARRVAAARAALFADTRRRLTLRLGVETADADSIIRLVRSQLELSLSLELASSQP